MTTMMPTPLRPAGMPDDLRRRRPAEYRLAPAARAPRHRAPYAPRRRAWNGVRTAVLLSGMAGLLVLLGSLFGRTGAVIGLVLGVATVAGSYWFSDRVALRSAGAVPVGPASAPMLHRIVGELSAEAGLEMPRLYVTPDRQPNAFATGRDPAHAAVAVTQGLLDLLTPAELRAVLAHELAHVRNRDTLLTSVAAALATGISFVAQLAGWLPFAGSSEEDEAPGPLAALVAFLVAPLAALLLQLALSRSREYEADRTGAWLCRDGRSLATALAKIERVAQRLPMEVQPAQAPKYVVNPLSGSPGRSLSALFMTHPPTAERIARLTGW
ncbi:M48 family metalloprotease [Blastococcus sp. SYSU DS0753]